ncbi:sigma factor G inhibitor Gin [Dethiobacter alkaliphilus]|uniref:sigma factor G inhibitor Gin n=1 Tax=Dethiobacter alkaliphilus TaxID=427926 RepID=UPI002227E08E|nr:sigma factor G inhibitor Gin [Dethiobacter alkaliphilus]MCW3489089.1 sigma factor G inhibitor Gin [Dethiobacter alkaliphilus]
MKPEICLFCGKETAEGLHIFQAVICRECEGTLVRTDTTHPRYPEYVEKLKRIWPACEAGY